MACLALLWVGLVSCAGERGQWIDRSDQTSFSRMVADVRRARVIFVGEFHDQRSHHQLQLDIIKTLHADGSRLAIGLEMFGLESQAALDRWVRGTMSLQEFVTTYQRNWTIPWAEYDTILLYARNNRIPLVALDAPNDIVRQITHLGFSSLSADQLARLPVGVDASMDDAYRQFMADAFAGHGLPEMLFANFCAAQALRNNTMNAQIGRVLTADPGLTMVVITGVGHAMKNAVAARLTARTGMSTRVIVPVVEGMFEAMGEGEADYFVSQ
ncbi:MAG TPA: ChaN family lipoprotein [Geobacteraceae bacterium]